MTVKELIDELDKVEDKDKLVVFNEPEEVAEVIDEEAIRIIITS